MEKLSIEEKAKAYDEAKARMSRAFNSNRCTIGFMNEIFPELAESEDERIIKALIKYFTLSDDNADYQCCGVHCKDILAWLEKQGSQILANNVEPKFKVGDFIVNDYCMGKVIELTNDAYLLDTGQGIPFSCEHNAHLWTIQDAKDGDVLYLQKDGKEHIIIYKGVIKERFRAFVSAYCAYNGIVDAFCFADVSRYVDIAYGGITPATKEQRDQLEKAMVNAGYKWNKEERKLEKI